MTRATRCLTFRTIHKAIGLFHPDENIPRQVSYYVVFAPPQATHVNNLLCPPATSALPAVFKSSPTA